MAEEWTEMRAFEVRMRCDVCPGFMNPTGVVLTSLPPLNEHICRNGHKMYSQHTYPRTAYSEV